MPAHLWNELSHSISSISIPSSISVRQSLSACLVQDVGGNGARANRAVGARLLGGSRSILIDAVASHACHVRVCITNPKSCEASCGKTMIAAAAADAAGIATDRRCL